MAHHRGMASQATAITCDAPGCNNIIEPDPAFRITTGSGVIHDFCNKTCLKEYMKGITWLSK